MTLRLEALCLKAIWNSRMTIFLVKAPALDMGRGLMVVNAGIRLRKLFEPSLHPKAKVHQILNASFDQEAVVQGKVCAVGFEPNLKHTTRLQSLEEA
jgi:hypothetical protein